MAEPDTATPPKKREGVIKKKPKVETKKKAEEKPKKRPIKPNVYIPSGSSLVDLACTDTLKGFCTAGHSVNFIGDRNSGKTALALGCMAETEFRHTGYFDLKFMDFENAYNFDDKKLYGEKFHKRFDLLLPENKLEWAIENVATRIVDDCKTGPQFIVLDSADGMKPIVEIQEILDGKPIVAQPYGGPRSKAMTAFFRTVCPAIAHSGSFMIVLSQAKANMGFDAQFVPKYRAGGKALAFYAHVEMWLAPMGAIYASKLKIGAWTKAKIARSKCNGKSRTVEFPIMPAYGIDDLRGNLRWLVEKKVISEHPGITIEQAKAQSKKLGRTVKPITKGSTDLGNIGIEYLGIYPATYIEENDLNDTILIAVKEMHDAIEQDIIDKTFGGRKGRYE